MAKRNGTPNYALREASARGDKFYQPDFLCSRGHMTKRLVSSGACYACHSINTKDYAKKTRRGPDGDAFRTKKNASLRKWKSKPENIERVREYARRDQAKHRKKHPINGRIDASNLRARRQGIEGKITIREISELLVKQENRCAGCAEDLQPNWNIDHIMPLRLKGVNKIENVQILCDPCNKSKGSLHPAHWALLKAGLQIT